MSGIWTRNHSRFKEWSASVGPGLVYILTVLGTGDMVSNAAAGASYGYSLIWALWMTLIFRFVWVNASARYVLVTRESLLTGYGRIKLAAWPVGKWIVWVILIALLPLRHFVNQYLILMVGGSAHLLLPLPTQWSEAIWSVLFTCLAFAMMFWGGYPLIESFCKVLVGLMGASLVVGALLSEPDWGGVLMGTLIPSLPEAEGLYSSLLILMALVGTEAGSVANLNYAYFISEKGWDDVSAMKRQRFDLALGVICMFIMGTMLQISAAGTVRPLGIELQGAEEMVRIFSETQGMAGFVIFGLGLWGATFSTLVGGNAGGALVFTDICRTFIPRLKLDPAQRQESKRDPVYRSIIAFYCFSPLYIIFTGVRPVWLTLVVSSAVVVLIPLLVLSLMTITNDKELMGRFRNGWLTNVVMGLLVALALYFTYRNGLEFWERMTG